MNISERDFTRALKNSWSRETSGDPEHRSDTNPSYRQCLVTALLANEILGLEVYSEKVTLKHGFNDYHYFNKDKAGKEYRFCEEQFDHEIVTERKGEKIRSKERSDMFLHIYPHIRKKYQLLRQKFQTELQKTLS